jgi:hypothetical protein
VPRSYVTLAEHVRLIRSGGLPQDRGEPGHGAVRRLLIPTGSDSGPRCPGQRQTGCDENKPTGRACGLDGGERELAYRGSHGCTSQPNNTLEASPCR